MAMSRAVRSTIAYSSGERALALAVRFWSGCGLACAVVLLAPLAGAGAQTRNGPTSVAPVAEKLIDAVVNIATSQTMKGPEGVPLPRVPKGAPFEEFFEDFFNRKGG